MSSGTRMGLMVFVTVAFFQCVSVGIYVLQLPVSYVSVIHTTQKSLSFSKGFPLRSLSHWPPPLLMHWLSVKCAYLTQAHLQSPALLCLSHPLHHCFSVFRISHYSFKCSNDDLL